MTKPAQYPRERAEAAPSATASASNRPTLPASLAWATIEEAARRVAPEAWLAPGRPLNLIAGEWSHAGYGKHQLSCVDGTPLALFPMIDLDTARHAVATAAKESAAWAKTDLDERRARVSRCVAELKAHRELLAKLLVWEIGKPYAQALVSVDRCVEGVEWYVGQIESMMAGRTPLGLVSNIASWNYPLSVLMHAALVQALAGNTVIAKTPSDGGLVSLTLAFALARRAGLPLSLVSGSGGQLSDALVRNDAIACLAFVGGKTNGGTIAASLYDRNKRYMLEMEGVNTYGLWGFSQWASLEAQLKKGFEYGKQRCTAYGRFVVQREIMPKFIDSYLRVMKSLRVGNPTVTTGGDTPPTLDFGPLINAKKVEELRVRFSEAVGKGAICLYEGAFDLALFPENQDYSAYYPPTALLNVPRNCELYHNEAFGPLDSIVVVDRIEELVTEMNVSGGALVSSVGCDDEKTARQIASQVRAFKVGINQVRSRGDRDEPFGGIGQSWKGCFVGGKYLVQAITQGEPGEALVGNFPDHTRLPASV